MFSVRTLKKGFTLVELMVVIAVIAILSGIAFFGFRTVQANARDTQRIQSMSAFRGQLERYYGDNNYYPSPTSWSTLMTTLQSNVSNLQDPGCGTGQILYAASDVPTTGGNTGKWMPTATGGCAWTGTGQQPTYQYTPTPTGCTNSSGNNCSAYTLMLVKEGGGQRSWSGPQ